MSNPYVGEIRLFGGNFAPAGWAFCNGQSLSISENDVLFSLIGTTYGGDGQTTFNLPDLQGRLPLHASTQIGNVYNNGQKAGAESVTLTTAQLPNHTHTMYGSQDQASGASGTGNVLARTQYASITPYGTDAPLVTLSPQAVSSVGGSLPHNNIQPYLCVSFIISLYGVYPSQN